MSSSLQTLQLANAHALLEHLNALNWPALADLLAPDFRHQYQPSTIVPSDGREYRGKEEWLQVLKFAMEGVFEKLVLKSDGVTKSGKKYNNEYMITFHFDGEKIVKLNEFVDSHYSKYYASLRAEAGGV